MLRYLTYDLNAVKPLQHFAHEPELEPHQAKISFEVMPNVDFIFLLVGDVGQGVQLISQVNLDTRLLAKRTTNLSINVDSDNLYFKEEAEVALKRLIQHLNTGESNNPDGAPYQPFTHNAHLFEWVAISL